MVPAILVGMLADDSRRKAVVGEFTPPQAKCNYPRYKIAIWSFYLVGWMLLAVSSIVAIRGNMATRGGNTLADSLFAPRYLFGSIWDSYKLVFVLFVAFVGCWAISGILLFSNHFIDGNNSLWPRFLRGLLVPVTAIALIWGTFVGLMHSPVFQSKYYLLNPSSNNGCIIVRSDNWAGTGGELLVKNAGASILQSTDSRWASETTNQNPFRLGYTISWDTERATVIAGDRTWEVNCGSS